jgi:Xaa-Pro aminopeptidase
VNAVFDHAGRISAARAVLADHDLDVLLLSGGPDLPYLMGYEAIPLERLTMAMITRDGDATLFVPELEAPRVDVVPELFELRPWTETEDPVVLVADRCRAARRVAVTDQTWAVFLLGLQRELPGVEFVSARPVSRTLRVHKDAAEVELLRRAAHAADRVVTRLEATRFSGRSEHELSDVVAQMTLDQGSDVATFRIVASGPNAASPHHEPGPRVIGEAYEAVRRAQEAGVAAVAPGVAAQDVDAAARSVIAGAGYAERFIHRLGHGIGLDVHEDPYLVEGNREPLEAGMAFSIEPGVYLPGRFGIRIEDIVVCTATGVDSLNQSHHDLRIVE